MRLVQEAMVAARLGRTFFSADIDPASRRTAILSHDLWHRLGRSPDILNRDLSVAGDMIDFGSYITV